MQKKLIQHFLVLLLLTPLLFIHIKNSHDWGDDFAQYIHQSQNLLNGVSQNTTGTIFNDTYFIGPKAYPVGFPMILSPLLYFFGYNLTALNIYMSLFLVLSCYLGFIFFSKHVSFYTALFTSLVIAYNPILLSLKTEVLSDLPYLFFSLLSLFLISAQPTTLRSIVLGFAMALSVHIRSVGWILVFISLLSFVFQLRKKGNSQAEMKPFLISITVFLLLFLILKLGFPCDTNYPFPLETENFWGNFNDHLSYNFENLFAFFRNYNSAPYTYIGLIAASTLISCGIAGLFISIRTNQFNVVNYYVIAYILVILGFKFGDAGFRFILPILFFIFWYAIIGASKMIDSIIKPGKWLPVIVGTILLLSFKTEDSRLIKTAHELNEGPEKPDAKKLFSFINSNLSENDIIEFEKPRVIALYSKARAVAIKPLQTEVELKNDLKKFKVNYILVHYILTDQPIRQYTQNPSNGCISVFKTNDLELFKLF